MWDERERPIGDKANRCLVGMRTLHMGRHNSEPSSIASRFFTAHTPSVTQRKREKRERVGFLKEQLKGGGAGGWP